MRANVASTAVAGPVTAIQTFLAFASLRRAATNQSVKVSRGCHFSQTAVAQYSVGSSWAAKAGSVASPGRLSASMRTRSTDLPLAAAAQPRAVVTRQRCKGVEAMPMAWSPHCTVAPRPVRKRLATLTPDWRRIWMREAFCSSVARRCCWMGVRRTVRAVRSPPRDLACSEYRIP